MKWTVNRPIKKRKIKKVPSKKISTQSISLSNSSSKKSIASSTALLICLKFNLPRKKCLPFKKNTQIRMTTFSPQKNTWVSRSSLLTGNCRKFYWKRKKNATRICLMCFPTTTKSKKKMKNKLSRLLMEWQQKLLTWTSWSLRKPIRKPTEAMESKAKIIKK